MTDLDHTRGPRPVPVTDAVRDLIRKTAAERPAEPAIERPAEPAADQPAAAPSARRITVDGVEWIARIVGEAVVGKGGLATGAIVVVRFHRADDSTKAVREAFLPRGHYEYLHDEELAALFRAARPVAEATG